MTTSRSSDDRPDMMDTFQLAKLLGHTPSQIRLMAQQGTLPAHRGPNGRQWLFDRDEVFEWIKQHPVVPRVESVEGATGH